MTTVFLAGDNQIVRAGLRASLERARHTIVGEGETVTYCFSEVICPSPQILFFDLHLGGQSGFELLTELQNGNQASAVIVLCGFHQPSDLAKALRMGVSGYVRKGSFSKQMTPGAVQALARVKVGVETPSLFEKQLRPSPKTVDTDRSCSMSKLELPDTPAPVHWAIRGDPFEVGDRVVGALLADTRGGCEKTETP